MSAEPLVQEAAAVPRGLRPMLLRSGVLPSAGGWSFEPKWDGFRALLHLGDPWRPVRLVSRHGTDLTSRFPELEPLADLTGGRRLVLDGELVVCGNDGRPDFDRLRNRMVARALKVRGAAAAAPAAFVAFDVLWLDGDVTGAPYERRRALLLDLGLDSNAFQVTPATTDGDALWRAVCDHELEGLVAKRTASRYVPGRRSSEWVKVKNWRYLDAVVCGFTLGHTGVARSLLLGLPADHEATQLPLDGDPPALRYIGEIEYGFRGDERAEVTALLAPHAQAISPLLRPTRHEHLVHVAPVVRVRVQYQCWSEGRLRHAIFRGLAEPRDV